MNSSDMMELSVIIPVFNSWRLTEACLESLRARQAFGDLKTEVIIADDGSFDETRERCQVWATWFTSFRVVCAERNGGFAKNCNSGAAAATGRFLVFLNNDTKAESNCLEILVRVLDSNPAVGIVGSKLLYPDGTIQHAGMAVDDSKTWRHVFRGLPGWHPLVSEPRAFQAVTGACLAVRTADFREVGGFDTGYSMSHEDVDLCFKISALGKHEIQPSAQGRA